MPMQYTSREHQGTVREIIHAASERVIAAATADLGTLAEALASYFLAAWDAHPEMERLVHNDVARHLLAHDHRGYLQALVVQKLANSYPATNRLDYVRRLAAAVERVAGLGHIG